MERIDAGISIPPPTITPKSGRTCFVTGIIVIFLICIGIITWFLFGVIPNLDEYNRQNAIEHTKKITEQQDQKEKDSYDAVISKHFTEDKLLAKFPKNKFTIDRNESTTRDYYSQSVDIYTAIYIKAINSPDSPNYRINLQDHISDPDHRSGKYPNITRNGKKLYFSNYSTGCGVTYNENYTEISIGLSNKISSCKEEVLSIYDYFSNP